MTEDDFDRLQTLMASRAGYRLTRDRIHLAQHRLGPVARAQGFDSVDALLAALWARPVAGLAWAVIEALLNPETWFRRDRKPFEVFGRELLPALARVRPGGRVSVWSAGCSAGQEPWSLAVAAREAGVDARILATDLSSRAVERTTLGVYSGFEIQRGLSASAMLEAFEPADDQWSVRPDLRDAVQARRENLLDPVADDARYDVIFCRNVLKDMEPARRAQVVDTLERRLVDDGCLFLGLDERPDGDSVAFRAVAGRPGLFVKAPSALRRAA